MSTRSARTSSNFNPRSSCEERLRLSCSTYSFPYFNPRSSCEERLHGRGWQRHRRNFNPRSSCEERHERQPLNHELQRISIHAPHARSDPEGFGITFGNRVISIHAPHARSDPISTISSDMLRFQSTLLMRGATSVTQLARRRLFISIHAPHARSDHPDQVRGGRHEYFNPRSSCEERRTGGASHQSKGDFNPRSSCEERLHCPDIKQNIDNFNPRSSCEERPFFSRGRRRQKYISIHAPHARSDIQKLQLQLC